MAIPIIETQRLRLRAHERSDAAACAAMWADPTTTQHISGVPSTSQQSWSRMLTYRGLWELLGYGYWALEDKASGRYVGEVGFADFQRDIARSMQNVPELGWVVAPEARGKGLATEGARAALAWCDTQLRAARTVCIVNEANLVSQSVADKLGYTCIDRARVSGAVAMLYERSVAS